jgi:hypothetical protein
LRKSTVPLAEMPSFCVSMAIERSTRATPFVSGSRTTAHTSSVEGSLVRNGLAACASRSNAESQVELRVDERGRPHDGANAAGRRRRPRVRRDPRRLQADVDVRAPAAHVAPLPGGGEDVAQGEAPAGQLDGEARRVGLRGVDGDVPPPPCRPMPQP